MRAKLAAINKDLNTNDDYEKIGTLFDFRLLVRTEKIDKDGLPLLINKFMVEGLDGIKYSYNNGHIATDPKLACENFIKALDTMPKLMAKHAAQNEELALDLPVLEEVVNGSWKKDAELNAVRDELTALNRKITAELEATKKEEVVKEICAPEQEQPADIIRPLYPPVEYKIASGSDIVPDYVPKPTHVPSNILIVRPGSRPKL